MEGEKLNEWKSVCEFSTLAISNLSFGVLVIVTTVTFFSIWAKSKIFISFSSFVLSVPSCYFSSGNKQFSKFKILIHISDNFEVNFGIIFSI